MILFIASSATLIVIYAGVKLLIQIKMEALNKLYKFIAWFIILMGFLNLFFLILFSVMHICYFKKQIMSDDNTCIFHKIINCCGNSEGMNESSMRCDDIKNDKSCFGNQSF